MKTIQDQWVAEYVDAPPKRSGVTEVQEWKYGLSDLCWWGILWPQAATKVGCLVVLHAAARRKHAYRYM